MINSDTVMCMHSPWCFSTMLAVIIIVWVVGSFVMLFNYYLSHYVVIGV